MLKMISLLGCLVLLTIALAPSAFAVNKVLSLDGDGDYVEVPDSDSLDIMNEITIETWVRFNKEISDYQTMVGKASSYLLRVDIPSEGARFSFFVVTDGAEPRVSGISPMPHQWYHVAGTYDGTIFKIYVNGHLMGEQPRTGYINIGVDSLFIGTNIPYRWDLDGLIDEVRIWKIARTQEEIHDAMNRALTDDEIQSENLVGYWNFDDGTVNDLSSYGNDGMLLGDALLVDSNPPIAPTSPDPDIWTSIDNLSFQAIVGMSQETSVTITNLGESTLEVTNINSDNAHFTVSTTTFTLAMLERHALIVSFYPTSTGTETGILTIQSNDPDEGTVEITLTGKGLPFINRALILDGDGDYVEIPHDGSLKLTESLTIEMWVKVIPQNGVFTLISNPNYESGKESGRGNYSMIVNRDSHEIEFGYQPPTVLDHTYVATNAVLDDKFNHLAVVHTFGDSTSTKMFLNGIQLSGNWIQGTGDEEVLINDDPIILGAWDMPSLRDFWNGFIDEVRIWNIARTKEDIRTTMNTTLKGDELGLVAYWHFDDSTTNDSSLYGNHGILQGDAEIIPLAGTWPPPLRGDVSGDKTVSAYDAALILQYVVGLIDEFPADSMVSPSAIEPHEYELSLPNVETPVGEKIQVPIAINDATGLLAGGITIKYDSTVLRAVDYAPLKLLNGYYWKVNTNLPGEVRFAFASGESTKGQGNLLMVEFEVLPNTEGKISPLILENVSLSNSRSITKINGEVRVIPSNFALLQNYPNPFNPETWIPFKLAQNAPVTISIYDAKGQLIRTIALGNRNAGVYITKESAAYWDGRDNLGEKVSSGVYFYTLQAGEFRATRKMFIVK